MIQQLHKLNLTLKVPEATTALPSSHKALIKCKLLLLSILQFIAEMQFRKSPDPLRRHQVPLQLTEKTYPNCSCFKESTTQWPISQEHLGKLRKSQKHSAENYSDYTQQEYTQTQYSSSTDLSLVLI